MNKPILLLVEHELISAEVRAAIMAIQHLDGGTGIIGGSPSEMDSYMLVPDFPCGEIYLSETPFEHRQKWLDNIRKRKGKKR